MKTLEDWKTKAGEIIRTIGVQSLGAGLFGGSAIETARDALAVELLKAYEEGTRNGPAAKRRKRS